jgi:ribosomal protein S18 acetylase RimI-like enzyme
VSIKNQETTEHPFVSIASINDAENILSVISSAFGSDPTWSWAFPEPSARRKFFSIFIHGALRFPNVYKFNNFSAASVWVPPGEVEFSEEQIKEIPTVLNELVGHRAEEVEELLHRFEEAHPRGEPHYYLSLLGCHPEHRGLGLGLALLKENLNRIDVQRMPAYLESSNPANNHKYESLGFKQVSSFRAPGNGPLVTGMWRHQKV